MFDIPESSVIRPRLLSLGNVGTFGTPGFVEYLDTSFTGTLEQLATSYVSRYGHQPGLL